MRKFYNVDNENEASGGDGYINKSVGDGKEAINELNRLTGDKGPAGETGLGKVETPFDRKVQNDKENMNIAMQEGWRPLSNDVLPSKAKYYPEDFMLTIRPADVTEIKFYSGMNEDDWSDANEKIMHVLNKCCRPIFGGRQKDAEFLKDADKLYLLFTIRDLTMDSQGKENKIHMTPQCPHCGVKQKVELINNIFGYYTIPDGIMKYYDEVGRCFIIPLESGENLKVYIPNMGVTNWIRKYVIEKETAKRRNEDNAYYDKTALNYIQFLVDSPGAINENRVIELTKAIKFEWGLEKTEAMQYLADELSKNIKPNITIPCKGTDGEVGCGKEFTTPITFRQGLRYLFNVTGVREKLFGHSE